MLRFPAFVHHFRPRQACPPSSSAFVLRSHGPVAANLPSSSAEKCALRCPRPNQHGADKAAAAAAVTAAAAVEEHTAEKVKDAVSRAQRETRRKYRARVLEVEAAFAQLAGDNRCFVCCGGFTDKNTTILQVVASTPIYF